MQATPYFCAVLVLLSFSARGDEISVSGHIYYKVNVVVANHLSSRLTKESVPGFGTVFMCALACGARDWCQFFWFNDGDCELMNLIIFAEYVDSSVGQGATPDIAYTARTKDHAFLKEAHVYSTATNRPYTLPLDGIFNFDEGFCYATPGGENHPLHYFVVDLSETRLIQEVRIITVSKWSEKSLTNLEVRVGQELQLGDYSSYQYFATIPDGPIAPHQEVIMKGNATSGRFVSLQRMVGENYWFTICHLEIR